MATFTFLTKNKRLYLLIFIYFQLYHIIFLPLLQNIGQYQTTFKNKMHRLMSLMNYEFKMLTHKGDQKFKELLQG